MLAALSAVARAAAPDTAVTSGPPGVTRSTAARFTFSSTKPGSSFQCRLDGGAWRSCASPTRYAELADGAHTFRVRARDSAGYVDPTPSVRTRRVDTVAPRVGIISPTAGERLGGRFTIHASAGDDVGLSRVEFFVRGRLVGTQRQAPYRVSFDAWSIGEGWAEVTVRAVDLAGNSRTVGRGVEVVGWENLEWVRRFGKGASSVKIARDASGVYVASNDSGGGFLRRYDREGTLVWTRGIDSGVSDVVANSTGVYILGSLHGRPAIRRYDADGGQSWTRAIMGAPDAPYEYTSVSDIAADATYVYVGGMLDGEPFLRKYDRWGGEVWTRYPQHSGPMHGVDVIGVGESGVYAVGSDRNCVVYMDRYSTGGGFIWSRRPYGQADGLCGAGAVAVNAVGAFVSYGRSLDRYDLSGDLVWTREAIASGPGVMEALEGDRDGVFVAGRVSGALPGGHSSAGGEDAFVRKYGNDGEVVWTRQFGTAGDDRATGITVDSPRVYVVGVGVGGGAEAFLGKL